jgi:hypothetical protein
VGLRSPDDSRAYPRCDHVKQNAQASCDSELIAARGASVCEQPHVGFPFGELIRKYAGTPSSVRSEVVRDARLFLRLSLTISSPAALVAAGGARAARITNSSSPRMLG